jgi:hypothetical protein
VNHLVCCLCLYLRTGLAPPAVTVMNGMAVCGEHAESGYLQGSEFGRTLRFMREQEAREQAVS